MATRIGVRDSGQAGATWARSEVLRAFFAGEEIPCPVGCGGESELVRMGTLPDGSGEVWFECRSCAQRRRFEIPRASRSERDEVSAQLAADQEPTCPRHVRREPLKRRGRQLVCGLCGVIYRD